MIRARAVRQKFGWIRRTSARCAASQRPNGTLPFFGGSASRPPEAAPAASPRAALSGQVQQNFCPAALASIRSRRLPYTLVSDGEKPKSLESS